MNELIKNIKEFVKSNPLAKNDYVNINPYFGLCDNEGILKNRIYIGHDYIVNIYGENIYLENSETGKTTKRKL